MPHTSGTHGRNARMGFLPDRDIGASGTNVRLKVAYQRHLQTLHFREKVQIFRIIGESVSNFHSPPVNRRLLGS